MPHPFYDADLYSVIVLDGVTSPGRVTLRGHNRYLGWEIQKSRATDGGVTIRGGDPPGQFEAQFDLSDEDDSPLGDLERWKIFRRVIESSVILPKPRALSIYHPDLAENGFTMVVSAGIGGAVRSNAGTTSYIVKFMEYRPPKPKPVEKPLPGIQQAVPKPRPDPNAARKAALEALMEEWKKP